MDLEALNEREKPELNGYYSHKPFGALKWRNSMIILCFIENYQLTGSQLQYIILTKAYMNEH